MLALTFTYVAFTVLAPWQLGKNTDTQEFNDRLEAALEHDPVPASDVLRPDGVSAGEDAEWTRVELQGRFLPDSEVLLRNRPVSSSPAFQVLTPFRTDDGLTVLVNRGWIAPDGAAAVPEIPAAPSTDLTVTGYVRQSEAVPTTAPIVDEGRQQVYGMNTAQIARLTDLPLAGDYVQLDEVSVAGPAGEELAAIPLPTLDSGPYLSYGIQWIAFGIMVPLGLGYFVWAEIRERRRQREEIAAAEAAVTTAAPGEPQTGGVVGEQQRDTASTGDATAGSNAVPESPAGAARAEDAVALTRERKLADRYGGARNRAFADRNSRDEERF
ncbi:hypothetical protein A606_04285 [Corynebacterium terpenotabidum Y-11]|uniref:SURF1-like protein n=1 Tax=Corynebacterium terpenotabidum Y-11 TaxID=1200352 RepID=S4XD82_9CORY|nr:hypothetical protein A606_04285 [Corynebacterium terpenotabidum Y-11]